MTALTFTGTVAGGLGPIEATFEPGLHVVLGASLPDLACLVELAAGARAPRRGRVRFDGVDVHRSPSSRKRIAAVLADEELLPGRSVREALAHALALRGIPGSADALLEEAGASALAPRDPTRLDGRERRLVAFALALALRDAPLLALADPLGLAPSVAHDVVLEHCRARAEHAVVLVTTPSLADAVRLGGDCRFLERGRLAPAANGTAAIAPQGLVVRSEAARRLASLLAEDSSVHSVVFDEQRTPREVVVRGDDVEALARALARVAATGELAIESVTLETPTLESVLLTRAGFTHPSFHARPTSTRAPA